MSWTEAQIKAIHHEYITSSDSLATVGARYGLSYEGLRQLFVKFDLPRRSVQQSAERQADSAARLAELQAKAEQQSDRIIDLYKQLGSVDAVLERVELPRKVVAPIIASIPNRENYRRRSERSSYPRAEVIKDLQAARDLSGEPLSVASYNKAAKEMGLVAFNTVIKCFKAEDPESPWQAALRAAGVKGNAARGKYPNSFTVERCIDAVAQCIRANHDRRVSYNTYCEWVPPELPSGPTIRNVVGWNNAVNRALDWLATGVL